MAVFFIYLFFTRSERKVCCLCIHDFSTHDFAHRPKNNLSRAAGLLALVWFWKRKEHNGSDWNQTSREKLYLHFHCTVTKYISIKLKQTLTLVWNMNLDTSFWLVCIPNIAWGHVPAVTSFFFVLSKSERCPQTWRWTYRETSMGTWWFLFAGHPVHVSAVQAAVLHVSSKLLSADVTQSTVSVQLCSESTGRGSFPSLLSCIRAQSSTCRCGCSWTWQLACACLGRVTITADFL